MYTYFIKIQETVDRETNNRLRIGLLVLTVAQKVFGLSPVPKVDKANCWKNVTAFLSIQLTALLFSDAADFGNTLSHWLWHQSYHHCALLFLFGAPPLQGAAVIDGSADYTEVDLTAGAEPSKTQYH